jgi:hypothetical protein
MIRSSSVKTVVSIRWVSASLRRLSIDVSTGFCAVAGVALGAELAAAGLGGASLDGKEDVEEVVEVLEEGEDGGLRTA